MNGFHPDEEFLPIRLSQLSKYRRLQGSTSKKYSEEGSKSTTTDRLPEQNHYSAVHESPRATSRSPVNQDAPLNGYHSSAVPASSKVDARLLSNEGAHTGSQHLKTFFSENVTLQMLGENFPCNDRSVLLCLVGDLERPTIFRFSFLEPATGAEFFGYDVTADSLFIRGGL